MSPSQSKLCPSRVKDRWGIVKCSFKHHRCLFWPLSVRAFLWSSSASPHTQVKELHSKVLASFWNSSSPGCLFIHVCVTSFSKVAFTNFITFFTKLGKRCFWSRKLTKSEKIKKVRLGKRKVWSGKTPSSIAVYQGPLGGLTWELRTLCSPKGSSLGFPVAWNIPNNWRLLAAGIAD